MTSFEDAVVRLNSRNISSLWRLCSYLSCIEVFGREDSPAFPLWNCEKVRLLCEAILASRAAPYKSRAFAFEDLRYVINAAHDALYDPRLKQEIQSGGRRQEMLYKLRRFFARTANVQLRQQEPRLFMTAGRMVAMLSALPRGALADFPAQHRELARAMPDEIEKVLGGSVFEYFLIHRSVWLRYQVICQEAFARLAQNPPPPSRRVEIPDERRVRYFSQLVSFFRSFEDPLRFTTHDLKQTTPSVVSAEVVGSYLGIFARDTRFLRNLRQNEAYKYGPIGWRLSPLERFPVVDLADGTNSYCVPNTRTFIRSFADVIHFTLQDALGERYNRFRGISQEVFLHRLVGDRLSLRQAIPERTYKKGRDELRGPDLALVEEPGPRLILVESKGRRLLAVTRFTMSDAAVDENCADAYDALQKLPVKVEDLLRGLPEYCDVQSDIDATKGSLPIAVIVLGEAAYMLTELLRYRAENDKSHALSGYAWPYCVMEPQTFEMAVEHASQESRPLHEVLAEFWEDSGRLEITDPMPEAFRGRPLKQWPTFAVNFLKPLLKQANIPFSDEE